MNNINKTLYIPLYGKAYVSERNMILHDPKAESIWAAEGFSLKGKSKSKWLAYYMAMRSGVFDLWVLEQVGCADDVIVLHLGCGMDSRAERVQLNNCLWYDVDFPEVIEERKKYYEETETYYMLGADVRDGKWFEQIPKASKAIVVMEGISMYMKLDELKQVLADLTTHFSEVSLLMDCYTTFAAKASKYKNPIHDVGVTEVYGMDDPKILEERTGLHFIKEHNMTPDMYIQELAGMEKNIFKKLYAGNISKKMYRLYEYKSQ